MPQDSIHDAAGGAPVEALRVDRAIAVEVRVRPSLEEQPEALEVVVGCADVQGADHQGSEAPGEGGPDVGRHVVVDINVSAIPTGGHGDNQHLWWPGGSPICPWCPEHWEPQITTVSLFPAG